MTDGPDWAETFGAIKNPSGLSAKSSRPGMDQVAQWQEFQQQRTGADVAVALGGVDTGDDYDGWAAVTEFAQGVVGGIADGVTNFGNLVEGMFHALTGNTGAASYVDPVDQLQYLVDTISGHAQAINQLQAANNGSETGGVVGGDNFQTPYAGSLGPGWSIHSTDGNTTYLGTANGKLEYTNQGNTTPLVTAQRIDPADAKTLTEFQKITITATAPTVGTGGENRIYGRMSDDRTHYVVAYHKDNTIYIAYAAGGAETVVDSGPMPIGGSLTAAARLALECGTDEGRDEYRVTINGSNAQSWTDTTGLATTSANYAARGLAEAPKGWMLGFRGQWNAPFPWQQWYGAPSALMGVTVADNVPVEIQGHGFRVYRESSSSTPNFVVSTTTLAQYYDTIDYISPGSAWSSSGYTIPKSGMWSFSWRAAMAGTGTWPGLCLALKINGASRACGGLSRSNNVIQDTVFYYCEKGDVVNVYVAILSGTANMVGSSSGIDTYFSGALMSG